MEDTPTQILKKVKDLERDHSKLKSEILEELTVFEGHINTKYSQLDTIEEEYVKLIAELSENQ